MTVPYCTITINDAAALVGITEVPLAGTEVWFTPNMVEGELLPLGSALYRVERVQGFINSAGKLVDVNGGIGVRLLANDDALNLEIPLQWKIEFRGATVNGFARTISSWWFEAPDAGVTQDLRNLAHVPGTTATGTTTLSIQGIATLGSVVFDAREYGVVPGSSNIVANLLDVMEQCRLAGGGTIQLPPGVLNTAGTDLGPVTADSGRTYTNNGAIPLPPNNVPVTILGHGVGNTVIKLSKGFPRGFDMWRTGDGQSYQNITIKGITFDRNNLQGSDLGPTITLSAPLNLPASGYVAVPGNHANWKNAKLAFFPEHNFIGFCYVSGTTLYVASVIGAVTIASGEHISGALHDHIIVGSVFHRGMYSTSNGYNMRIDNLTVEDVTVVNAFPEPSPPAGTAAFSKVPQTATSAMQIHVQRSGDYYAFVPSVTNVLCKNVRIYGGASGIVARGENRCFVDNIRLEDCYHDTLVDPLANYFGSNYLIGGNAWVGKVAVVRCVGRRSGDVALELDSPWDALEEDCVWEDCYANSLFRLTVTPPARTAAGPPTTTLAAALGPSDTTATVASMPDGVDTSGLAMIDSELIAYKAVGTSWTIWRGLNRTTAAAHSGVGSGVNILPDGTFESNGSSEDAHSGSKSYKITIPNDGGGNQTFEFLNPYPVNTSPGTVYNTSFWIKPKSTNASTGGAFYVRAQISDSSGVRSSDVIDYKTVAAPTSGGWVQHTATFTMPAGYDRVQTILWAYGVTAGNIYYLDDFLVAPTGSVAGATVTFVQADRTRITSVRQTVRASASHGTTPYAIVGYDNILPHAPLTVRDPKWEYRGGDFKSGFALGAFGWCPEIDISGLRMTHDVSHPAAGDAGSVIGTGWQEAWSVASSGAPLPIPVFTGRNNFVRATGSMSNTSIYGVYAPGNGSWFRWDFDIDAAIDIAGAGAGNIRFWDIRHAGAPNFIDSGSRLGIKARTPSGTVAPVAFAVVGAFPDSRYSGNGTRIVDSLDLELDLSKLSYSADSTDSNYIPWQIDSTQATKVRVTKVKHPTTAGKYPTRRLSAVAVSGDYTVQPDDEVLLVNSGVGSTITLPPVTGGNSAVGQSLVRGRQLAILDSSYSAASRPITITPAAADSIDNGTAGASVTISVDGGHKVLVASDSIVTMGANLVTDLGWETAGSTEAAHTGSKSFKMPGGTGFFYITDEFPVTAGAQLYAEFWVRGKTTNSSSGGPVFMNTIYSSSTGTPSGTTGGAWFTVAPPADATWRRYTGTFTVPAGGWDTLRVQVGTYNSPSADTYYVDDAIVAKLSYKTGWIVADSDADLTQSVADTRYQPLAANLTALAAKTAPSGALVGTTDTQTISGKTLLGTKETVYAITDGAAFEIDPANGGIQTLTIGANRTPKATNFAAGQSVTLMIAATSSTITWTDSTLSPTWVGGSAPTLSSTKTTVITLWKVGSTIYGCLVGTA